MADDVDFEALARVAAAFRPAQPIEDQLLFAGRTDQLRRLIDVIFQPGQHAVIYGVRGVGKTSLARVTTEITGNLENRSALLYTCNSGDTFDGIWRSVLEDIQLTYIVPGVGFAAPDVPEQVSAVDLLGRIVVNHDGSPRQIRPDDVRRAMGVDSRKRLIVIDEFDRIRDRSTRELFADTIKALSDRGLPVTLVLVGVADSVEDLIDAHPSVERSVAQIPMPTMSPDELGEIIDKGMNVARLTADPVFRDEVVRLAHGLPNYVHLLGQNSARAAVEQQRTHVTRADLDTGIARAVEMVDESVMSAYHRATTSNRETIYREVLLACALATRDERDTFSAVDVRDQLVAITGTYRDIPAFAGHLKDFSGSGDRGQILDRIGSQRRYRYRFCNPLLPPYVLMKGRLGDAGTAMRLPMWVNPSPSTSPEPHA